MVPYLLYYGEGFAKLQRVGEFEWKWSKGYDCGLFADIQFSFSHPVWGSDTFNTLSQFLLGRMFELGC